MGCGVTSIYADQVIGKIDYPDQILADLRKRDFSQPYQIKNKNIIHQLSTQINSIYGFTQSFCQGFLFTTVIAQNQFLVYNNGRFVIKILKNNLLNTKNSSLEPQMSILPHEDQICVMDVNQNMCIVGLSGGKMVLWDLKFNEIKIQIYLPKPSCSFSSISLSQKYIFVTDTNLPNNIAYCFDIQTTKIKSSAIIDSIEPTLKGIRFQQNQHVIISAEGLWFMRFSNKEQKLLVTKGMFLTFPKTSQCSISSINEKYLVSGGVDGYVYVWNSNYECVKVIKCFERQQPITAITFNKERSSLILGSMEGKIKCFNFSIKLRPKKTQEQPNQNQRPEMEEYIEYLLTQALDEQFGIQNLVTTQEDSLVYLALNCRGSMMSHLLPSTEPYSGKIKHLNNCELIRFSRKGDVILSSSSNSSFTKQKTVGIEEQKSGSSISLINVYPKGTSEFNIDRLKTTKNKSWMNVQSKSVISTRERSKRYLNVYSYCKHYSSVAYIAQNSIYIDFQQIKQPTFSLRQELEATTLKQGKQSKQIKIMELSQQNVLISLNYLEVPYRQGQTSNYGLNHENKQGDPSLIERQVPLKQGQPSLKEGATSLIVYFFVTFEDECSVFEVKSKTQYILHTNIKFLKRKFNKFTLFQSQTQQQLKFNGQQPKQAQQTIPFSQEPTQQMGQIKTEVEFNEELKIWQLYKLTHSQNIPAQINQSQLHSEQTSDNFSQTLNKAHCSYIKTSLEFQNTLITIGGSSLILWNPHPIQQARLLKNF